MKKKTHILIAVFCVICLAFAFWYVSVPSMAKAISPDYLVTETIADMNQYSDVVVKGTYTEKGGTWNTARNPEDITQEDPLNYSEGQMFTFLPDQVLKGDISLHPIQICLVTCRDIPYEPNDSKTVFLNDPMYLEPEIGTEYVLFLRYDPDFDTYTVPFHPYALKVEDDVCYVASNLIQPNPGLKTSAVVDCENHRKMTIHYKTPPAGSYNDTISGTSLSELIRQIQ